jgi:cell division transport system permease protein
MPRAPRPTGFDALGLRRALSDRMLPLVVAAMTLLAGLALAGWHGASGLARQWREGAGSALTVQVPEPSVASQTPGLNRLDAVMAALRASPGIAEARPLSEDEMGDLLRPWLGSGTDRLSIPLPAVIAARSAGPIDPAALSRRLGAVAPGTLVDDHASWVGRLSTLARSLQACAGLALGLVVATGAIVIAVATTAGLASRREAIEIVHGLGATDGFIAGRFARRVTLLVTMGGVLGALVAAPLMLGLALLAEPFGGEPRGLDSLQAVLDLLPPSLWVTLPALPMIAGAIGWVTTRVTVGRWLRRLP